MRAIPLLILLLAAPALAGSRPPEGDYDVTFTRAGSTCDPNPTDFDKGIVTFTRSGKKVKVVVPLLGTLRGTVKKEGAFEATSRRGSSGVAGIDGEYALSGTAKDADVELVIVARYFVKGRPYCETSWNARGSKKKR